ncbi:MAG: hypothetical protein ACXVFV_01025 [Mycobacteriales bacterium]
MSSRNARKLGASAALLASGLVAGGVLAAGMTANAATPSPSPSTATTAPARGASSDTAVTGTEADKVKAAVTAAHSGTTITTVRKDPDGSYDALGTDASGNRVFYDVSADLKTITAGGGGHLPGSAPGATSSAAPTA